MNEETYQTTDQLSSENLTFAHWRRTTDIQDANWTQPASSAERVLNGFIRYDPNASTADCLHLTWERM